MYPKYTVPVTFDSLIPGGRHEISVWSVAGNKTSEPFTTSLFTCEFKILQWSIDQAYFGINHTCHNITSAKLYQLYPILYIPALQLIGNGNNV